MEAARRRDTQQLLKSISSPSKDFPVFDQDLHSFFFAYNVRWEVGCLYSFYRRGGVDKISNSVEKFPYTC